MHRFYFVSIGSKMRLRRILACGVAVAPLIACAHMDAGPPVPCTADTGTVLLRDTVTIRAAGALLPLTDSTPGNLLVEELMQSWRTSRSAFNTEVTTDSSSEPLTVDDISLPSVKSKLSSCRLTIEGHRATVTTYFERTSSVEGPYIAIGSYQLAPNIWLVIASTSKAPTGQREMVASLRALRFLPPVGSKERKSPKRCPPITLHADTSHWHTYAVRSAPVTFKAPADAQVKKGYTVEAWEAIGTRIDFAPVGDSWTLEPLANEATLWCAFSTADGLPGEIAILPAVQQHPSPGFDIGIAYITLSPGRSLSVFAFLFPKSEGPPPVRFRPIPELNEQFRVLVGSIRRSR